jgi:rubrerythrin
LREHRDLKDMIEVLSIAIVREETEEEFFRRSAKASTSRVAAELYREIAEEFSEQRQSLEARKDNLEAALRDLMKVEKGE